MKCQICTLSFEESELELSHDIPKYMGGTDKDGRHYLCVNCHNDYEQVILSHCFLHVFDKHIPFLSSRKECIPFMATIRFSPENKKQQCIKIAKEVRDGFFKNPPTM